MDDRADAGTTLGDGTLLEREDLARELVGLMAAAREGRGTLAVVAGGPGDGKSALLGEATRLAGLAGLHACFARGSHLEQPFAFGVARQLLQPEVMKLEPAERAGIFVGAARLAMSVL